MKNVIFMKAYSTLMHNISEKVKFSLAEKKTQLSFHLHS